MPYLTAIKYGVIFAAVVAWNMSVYNFGYRERDQLAVISDQKQQIETAALNNKVSEEQAKNSAYALFIETHANAQTDEINKLNDDLLNAHKLSKQRKVCTSRLPQASISTGAIDTADDGELSREFEEFLVSQAARAELERKRHTIKYEELIHMCKTGQAICKKKGEYETEK